MSLTLADILPNAEFQAGRRRFEAEILAVKAVRRLAIGPNMTMLFENRQTCWWQVQEMCRVENIVAPAAMEHELATYNALLPTSESLSATLLLEYDDAVERVRMLTALLGLHQHVSLAAEGLGAMPARFDEQQFNLARISAVQFVRIPLAVGALAALGDFSRPVSLDVSHPAYPISVPLPRTLRAALLDDLSPP
jgi:hypothetical protein